MRALTIWLALGGLAAVFASGCGAGVNIEKYGMWGPRSNAFVYALDAGGARVAGFRVSEGDGSLSPVPGSPYSVPSGMVDLAVSPVNGALLALNQTAKNVTLYSIDPGTGALTLRGTSGAITEIPKRLLVDPSGKFVVIVDPSNPAHVATYPFDRGVGIGLTVLGARNVPGGIRSAESSPSGAFLFFATSAAAGISSVSLDGATGALGSPLSVSPTYGSSGVDQVAVDPRSRALYGIMGQHLTSFQVTAGTGALVEGSSLDLGSSNFFNSAIVEPAGEYLFASRTFGATSDLMAYSISGDGTTLAAVTTSASVSTPAPLLGWTCDFSGRFFYSFASSSSTVAGFFRSGGAMTLAPVPGGGADAGFTPIAIRMVRLPLGAPSGG